MFYLNLFICDSYATMWWPIILEINFILFYSILSRILRHFLCPSVASIIAKLTGEF